MFTVETYSTFDAAPRHRTNQRFQLLEVVAVYPAEEKKVTFKLKYLMEVDAWKLGSLWFKVEDSNTATEEK